MHQRILLCPLWWPHDSLDITGLALLYGNGIFWYIENIKFELLVLKLLSFKHRHTLSPILIGRRPKILNLWAEKIAASIKSLYYKPICQEKPHLHDYKQDLVQENKAMLWGWRLSLVLRFLLQAKGKLG